MSLDTPIRRLEIDDYLHAAAAVALDVAQALRDIIQIELRMAATIAAAATGPEGAAPTATGEMMAVAHGVDATDLILAASVPRVALLTNGVDKMTRSVGRSVGLLKQIEAGWPRRGPAGHDGPRPARTATPAGEALTDAPEVERAEDLLGEQRSMMAELELNANAGRPLAVVLAEAASELTEARRRVAEMPQPATPGGKARRPKVGGITVTAMPPGRLNEILSQQAWWRGKGTPPVRTDEPKPTAPRRPDT